MSWSLLLSACLLVSHTLADPVHLVTEADAVVPVEDAKVSEDQSENNREGKCKKD